MERRLRSEQSADQGAHKQEPRDPSITWLPKEIEEGNREYKLRLRDPSSARLEQLVPPPPFPLSHIRFCQSCPSVHTAPAPRASRTLQASPCLNIPHSCDHRPALPHASCRVVHHHA